MYCRNCRLHFSGSRTEGRCPNCGRPGESTPVEGGFAGAPSTPRPLESDTTRISAAATRDESRADTRTEDGRAAGVWGRGTIVAGKYEIIRKIGSGGFGTVYRVRHIHRKKLYALKVPHPEYLRDETFQKRFEREIEALERFVHPDMVIVRDSGIAGGNLPYYTMDFIEGESLREVMNREGPLDIRRAVNIIRRILQVLDVAHRHSIVHRDIKPDNILLTQEEGREVVKVLDFGVAKLLDLVGNTTDTITHGMRVGTPKYMSPEQVTGDPVDGRSDLFAVGILLYEALTGQHPFAVAGDPIRTTAAILSKEPTPPLDLRPEIPRGIAEKVLWMLEKKPKKRPQDAAAILEALPDIQSAASRSLAGVEELEFHREASRQRISSLVLSRETPDGIERFFLLFKPVVTFGRSNDARKGLINDLILRRLPCRSAEEDAENWNLNLTISHRVASIRLDGNAVVIEPWPESQHGVMIGGLRSREPVRIQSDHFQLSLGNRALEIDAHRVLRDHSRKPVDLSFIPPLEKNEGDLPEGIGYSDLRCSVNCIRLCRGANHLLHSYFLVYRRLAVGSGAGADLRIAGEGGVEGHHASLIFERGELFLVPVAAGVRVLPAGGKERVGTWGGASGETELPTGSCYPLVPGVIISLGSVRLVAEAIQEEMFKKV